MFASCQAAKASWLHHTQRWDFRLQLLGIYSLSKQKDIRNTSEMKCWAAERNRRFQVSPGGCAHTEEEAGRAGGGCTSHEVMSAGSAGCEKHSSRILQHQEPLLHHCPVNATRGKWGMECSSHVHIQGLAGKQEPPNNGAASSPEHGARWRLLTKCLMDTAAFPHSSSLTAGGRRTAVAATLCCPLAHSSRVVAQFLSLPDSPIASAHFSCWVSHQTCQDFSVCLPRLYFFFSRGNIWSQCWIIC